MERNTTWTIPVFSSLALQSAESFEMMESYEILGRNCILLLEFIKIRENSWSRIVLNKFPRMKRI